MKAARLLEKRKPTSPENKEQRRSCAGGALFIGIALAAVGGAILYRALLLRPMRSLS